MIETEQTFTPVTLDEFRMIAETTAFQTSPHSKTNLDGLLKLRWSLIQKSGINIRHVPVSSRLGDRIR